MGHGGITHHGLRCQSWLCVSHCTKKVYWEYVFEFCVEMRSFPGSSLLLLYFFDECGLFSSYIRFNSGVCSFCTMKKEKMLDIFIAVYRYSSLSSFKVTELMIRKKL